MASKAQRAALRGAVYQGDGRAVVDLFSEGGLADDVLQLAGDGVVAAVVQHVPGALDVARGLSRALRQRGWDGDDHLASQLDALIGAGPVPMLRALSVDLDELASVLEGDPVHGGGRIDLRTGEVWPQAAIDYVREESDDDEDADDDPQHWLHVHCEGSARSYRDMELFVRTISDPGRADRLAIAIQGRGAFRRFKDVLARWPDELDRWFAFSEERQRGRARSWLAVAGYRVAPQQARR
jgi:Uncharacterised protein family (UPF0158)